MLYQEQSGNPAILWYILWSFGTRFPNLVCYADKKNLAALPSAGESSLSRSHSKMGFARGNEREPMLKNHLRERKLGSAEEEEPRFSFFVFFLWPITLFLILTHKQGFEPGSSVSEADAMSSAPRRHRATIF
jgi:hypothetical protein